MLGGRDLHVREYLPITAKLHIAHAHREEQSRESLITVPTVSGLKTEHGFMKPSYLNSDTYYRTLLVL